MFQLIGTSTIRRNGKKKEKREKEKKRKEKKRKSRRKNIASTL